MEFELTQETLKQILNYDSNSGCFTYKISPTNGIYVGDIAGCLHKSTGYRRIIIKQVQYRMHRLAWLYVYGKFPEEYIDHINGDKSDNRICNLREATNQQNQLNRGKAKTNSTGFKCVSFSNNKLKYRVKFTFNKIRYNLGTFDYAKDANNAYENFVKNLHGEFYYIEE